MLTHLISIHPPNMHPVDCSVLGGSALVESGVIECTCDPLSCRRKATAAARELSAQNGHPLHALLCPEVCHIQLVGLGRDRPLAANPRF